MFCAYQKMKAANPVDRMDVQINRGMGLGLSRGAATKLARLRTPERIQDFISAIPINFEPEGDTALSVAEVLKQNRAHCFEGALVAACALYQSGQPPLLMDMSACEDDDHVLAIFRRGGCWGAISKGNSVWLRFRDPIYRSLRELAMSYFHEYGLRRKKTLRSYSAAVDLRQMDSALWVTHAGFCQEVIDRLTCARHYSLISTSQERRLRCRDDMELRIEQLRQFEPPAPLNLKSVEQ